MRGTTRRRILGATGISVSEFALGAMMFGRMGNPDHDDAVRIIHRALEAGIDVLDPTDNHAAEPPALLDPRLRRR